MTGTTWTQRRPMSSPTETMTQDRPATTVGVQANRCITSNVAAERATTNPRWIPRWFATRE